MAVLRLATGNRNTAYKLAETLKLSPWQRCKPVLQVAPGDRVVIETVDTFEGKIRTERDLPTQKLHAPFLNPQCGPIMMEDASKGDVLAVYIESIVPRGQNPRGTVCMIPHFGGLTGTGYAATLNEPLPERVKKVNVDENSVYSAILRKYASMFSIRGEVSRTSQASTTSIGLETKPIVQ